MNFQNYSIQRNPGTNTLDVILAPEGQMRIMNADQSVFEIDYLGNTVYNNNVKSTGCVTVGDKGGQMCYGAKNDTLDLSNPNGIRMMDNIMIQKQFNIGNQNVGVGYSATKSNMTMYAGNADTISFQVGDSQRMIFQNDVGKPNVVMTGDTQVKGSVTAPMGHFDQVNTSALYLDGVKLHAVDGILALDRQVRFQEIDADQIKTNTGIQVDHSTYGPLIEANYGTPVNRLGVGHYKNGEMRMYGSGLNQVSSVHLGFATGSDSWDDRITIDNGRNDIQLNGNVHINGSLILGEYKITVDPTNKNKLQFYVKNQLVGTLPMWPFTPFHIVTLSDKSICSFIIY